MTEQLSGVLVRRAAEQPHDACSEFLGRSDPVGARNRVMDEPGVDKHRDWKRKLKTFVNTDAVTIKDVAHESGVNISAVSRPLNNGCGVNDQTREHEIAVAVG